MNKPFIALENFAIGYNGQAVLSGISLFIARSSFTAILGANGSGKSTLLKTLLGLQPPVAGRMQVASSANGPRVFGSAALRLEVQTVHIRFDDNRRSAAVPQTSRSATAHAAADASRTAALRPVRTRTTNLSTNRICTVQTVPLPGAEDLTSPADFKIVSA